MNEAAADPRRAREPEGRFTMPTIWKGDWFELAADGADLALFTGNSTIRRDGGLVMGRGLARAVRDRFPGIDRELARAIGRRAEYGVAVADGFCIGRAAVGAFQVKRFWGDAADLGLIAHSVKCQNALLEPEAADYRVVLNYPGIGNGRLTLAQVAPLIAGLDARVMVCYR